MTETTARIDHEVIADLKRLTKLLQAPQKMADAIEIVASYDQSIADRTSTLAALDERIAAAQASVLSAEADATAGIEAAQARLRDEVSRVEASIAEQAAAERAARGRVAALHEEVAELETKAAAIRDTLSSVRI